MDLDPELRFDFSENALQGRVILLAGGSGGLGSACSTLLALAGATVVIGFQRNRERAEALKTVLEARAPGRIHLLAGNLEEEAVRERWATAADALEGGLYGLVCLTGDPARVGFEDLSQADLEQSMRRNYYTPLLLARAAAARMQQRNTAGAMVFISSMQGIAAFDSSINYAGPKAALVHAAKILARQWGGRGGLRVNVVAPGVHRAGMALPSLASGKYDAFVEQGIIPRFGKAEDVARVVRLLLEPDNYITGQVITVDGGLTLRR